MSHKHISSPCARFTFIYDSKKLFAWGYNGYGQFGLGHNENVIKPTFLMKDENILQIACGENHVLILKTNGEIWGCGRNDKGQIGFEDLEDRTKFELLLKDESIVGIRCGEKHSLFWKSNGDIYGFGRIRWRLGI